jgi:hypothetical protein
MSSTSSPLASAAVKVGVPRKLFHEGATKRKQHDANLNGEEVDDKENAEHVNLLSTTPKRESRLKKLKSSKNLNGRLSPKVGSNSPARSPAMPLAATQGVPLPPPLCFDEAEEEDEGEQHHRSEDTTTATNAEETLKMLTDIVARKRGAAGTPSALRPQKKARSLCGAEAAKLIRRRGHDDALESGSADAAAGVEEAIDCAPPSTLTHQLPRCSVRRAGSHARRASLDGSAVWMARWQHEQQKQHPVAPRSAMEAEPRGMTAAAHSATLPLVLPLPLWRDARRNPTPAAAAAAPSSSAASPSQAERRRRRSRSVGDLKQLLAAEDASTTAKAAAQPPKKRERRRKRNSLVRAIDKLISVAGIAGAWSPDSHVATYASSNLLCCCCCCCCCCCALGCAQWRETATLKSRQKWRQWLLRRSTVSRHP